MNALPLFHFPALQSSQGTVHLTEEIRKHAITVLRMQPGEKVMLTDGKGCSAEAVIVEADKKKMVVGIQEKLFHTAPPKQMILGI